MGKKLDDADRAVIDPDSVKQFEAQGDPPADPPNDPPADDPNPDDPPPDDPPADDPPPDPQTRRMAINGVMQDVPADLADQIEAERQAIEARIEQERESMTRQPNDADPPNDGEDFDAKFWANPRQALSEELNRYGETLKKELTESQRKKEDQDKFWSDFYIRYPELKSDNDIVEMVMQRNWNELERLEIGKAMDEIASRAAQRIGKTLKSRDRPASQQRTASEPARGGDAPPPKEPNPDEPGQHKSLSQLLKERRAKRQQAG